MPAAEPPTHLSRGGMGGHRTRRHREGLETMVDVLRAAMSGARKSHIMLKANLNSVKAGRIITHLVSAGLLRPYVDGETPIYCTTERGLYVVRIFEELESLLLGRVRPIEAPVVQD